MLRGILDRAAAQVATTTDPVARKLGTFYATCMDSTSAERAGIEPIADVLQRIDAIADRAQLQDELARMHSLGYGGGFGFGSTSDPRNARFAIAYATQGGLGLPDRDYYIRADAEAQSIRARYLRSIARMFELAGDSAVAAAASAARVLDLETALAKAQLSRVALRDPNARYHHQSVAEASASTGIDWARYLATMGLGDLRSITINAPPFFSAVGSALATRPLDDWKAYLRWTVLWRSASQLGAPFVDESFKLASMLTGARAQQPRWRRCLVATDQTLGDALGREYVKTEFTPLAKAKMLEVVQSLREVLRDRITRADWMSEATREQALAKLASFNQKIGYPDHWQDYATLEVLSDSYAANMRRARANQMKRDLARVGKPVDRDQWLMTAPTVNAYYSASLNEIAFPAGRLQPPFFSATYDEPANYGGIGATIGHELSHGFDDSGRKYDATGNVRDWWTAGGRAALRRARGRGRAAVRLLCRDRHAAPERTADPGREHRRRRGRVDRLRGDAACDAGQAAHDDRRLHPGAALLSRLCAGATHGAASRSHAHDARDGSPLPGPLPRQRPSVEHARVRAGVWVRRRVTRWCVRGLQGADMVSLEGVGELDGASWLVGVS